jgi:leucyl-tRNA synthetase
LHLLYSRFFVKALTDCGYMNLREPFSNLLTQGMVLMGGAKMSKSKGNVVDPTAMIAAYGADTVRLFCLFAAPPERDFDWTESGIEGAHRFVNRLWRFVDDIVDTLPAVEACSSTAAEAAACPNGRELRMKEHATVKKAGEDIAGRFQFNTAIAAVRELLNLMYLLKDELLEGDMGKRVLASAVNTVLVLLFPVTPHVCEELRHRLGFSTPLVQQSWPVYSEEALARDTVEIVIQVNGKLRGKIQVPADEDAEPVKAVALADPSIQKHIAGLAIRKVILVPGKLVNVVAG